MNAPIFMSYASKDREAAASLCQALENRGFRCWISSRDIGPGENFQVAIPRAIQNAKVMVLVFSGNSNNSDEVKKELALAGQNRLIVIPVRVEDVTPGEAFSYELATRQWIDLFGDWEDSIQRLAHQLMQVAEVAPEPPAMPHATEPPASAVAAAAAPRPGAAAAARPANPAAKMLTRFGFNLIVAIYLAPLVVIDIVTNSRTTGAESDLHYFSALGTALLLGYAVWGLVSDNGTTSHQAAAWHVNGGESGARAGNLGAADHAYCVILGLFGVFNWYTLHQLNRTTTGLISIATLVWSFMSLIVLLLAAVQFWNMKSGRLVTLHRKPAER